MNSKIKKLHNQLQEGDSCFYIAATGGGLGWIPTVFNSGGASSYIKGVNIPYSMEASTELMGASPIDGKFVSAKTSRLLALAAFNKCKKYNQDNKTPVGIGLTCSLKVEGEREGRIHRAFISYISSIETVTVSVEFRIGSLFTREQEDSILGDYMMDLMANPSQALKSVKYAKVNKQSLSSIIFGGSVYELPEEYNVSQFYSFKDNYAILSGSFNPIHDGHLKMAKAVQKETGMSVFFELSFFNYEKPQLDIIDINDRTSLILDEIEEEKDMGLIYSTCPRFFQKARIYPNATFIVGQDTYLRLQPKDIETLLEQNCNLIVFPRAEAKDPDFDHPPELLHEDNHKFKNWTLDISSSQIRKSTSEK